MSIGRPRKEIKRENFEKLCSMMCTQEEICGFFGVTDKTLNRWCKENYNATFSEAFKVYSADGKISLRRHQFKLAEKSAAMAIFLGKQYLGQRDNIEIEDSRALDRLDEILAGVKANAIQQETE